MPTKAATPTKRKPTVETAPINFSQTLDPDALPIGNTRSSWWTERLQELADAVDGGDADVDKFYCLRTYPTATGARTAVRSLEKNPARLPGRFDLRTKVTRENGSVGSQVWGAVPSDTGDEPED